MPMFNDLSRSLVAFDQDTTLVAVIGMGSVGWLVGGLVPGVSRAPLSAVCCAPRV
jgi:transposase